MTNIGLVSALRNASGQNNKLCIKEAYVISTAPLKLECCTDNKLIISDSNLFPLSSRFFITRENAVIYYNNSESTSVEIEIDNSIKIGELFVVLEVNNGETCRYMLIDRLGGGI